MAARDPRLRAFVKIDKQGDVVPGSLVLRLKKPEGFWLEISANVCCSGPTSNYEFDQTSGSTAAFSITVGGQPLVNAISSVNGNFNPGGGAVVTVSIPAAGGGDRRLLVVNETGGNVLTNQNGTGALTFSFTSVLNNTYTILGTAGTTTTSTTSTTTTTTTT